MRGTFEEPPTGLIPWFSKLREILTLHFAASPSPLRGKLTQAQDIARTHGTLWTRQDIRHALQELLLAQDVPRRLTLHQPMLYMSQR